MKTAKLVFSLIVLLLTLLTTFTVQGQASVLNPGSAQVQESSVLIKAEAKTRSSTLATVKFGAFVQILQVNGKWAQVQSGDVAGWMPVSSLANADSSIYDMSNVLPAPTGSYGVGRVEPGVWVDESRTEKADEPHLGQHPVLQARIWYPADVPADAVPAPYVDLYSGQRGSDVLSAIPVDSSMPAVQRLLQSSTHTYEGVPVSSQQATYPVIVFFVFQPESFTAQIEELVSHGYIVVSFSRSYYYGEVIMPNGTIAAVDAAIRIAPFNFNLLSDASDGVKDLSFVLDHLTALNAADPQELLTGKLDLDHIGLLGHQFSANLASVAAQDEPRFRAIVGLDGAGVVDEAFIPESIQQPYLYMTRRVDARAATSGPCYTATIPNFTLMSFVDLLYTEGINLTPLGDIGMFDNPRRVNIVRAYLGAFFDTYLKNQPNALLDNSSPDYPEVTLYSNNMD